jgi:hypothetical protein
MNRTQTTTGYWQIPDPVFGRRRVFEHRLVVELFMGRLLRPEEEVHHIDFCPDHNAITNLVMLGAREHRLLHHPYRHDPSRANGIVAVGRRSMLAEAQRHGSIAPPRSLRSLFTHVSWLMRHSTIRRPAHDLTTS